jgi:hypothetical protein
MKRYTIEHIERNFMKFRTPEQPSPTMGAGFLCIGGALIFGVMLACMVGVHA